jgi:light-regulated signal transduction histidine kinase (bacteriophytochrome)
MSRNAQDDAENDGGIVNRFSDDISGSDDIAGQWSAADATQKAFLNILEDSNEEKGRLGAVQSAVLNILEDFDTERKNVEQANAVLRHEVAERTRAEAALRRANAATAAANKELEAFSYSVAHDLRAPLRSIDGFSQALVEDCADNLPAEGRTYIGHLRESAQHMARLIDGLLSLSRLGRTEISRSRMDLVPIVRAIFARFRREQPGRSVELIVPAEVIAIADVRMMEVLFENLLENAWKFTSKRPHARIEFGQVLRDGHLVCYFRDNGAGFDMEYAGKLFAVFQRLHTTSEFEGTGIGLANVERIVHRHGGRIWGEGEVDRGATFYFTLEEGT